jgi:hypothetical protein
LASERLHPIQTLFRLHQKVLVDFTPGRPMPTKLSWIANPLGLPHSRWVKSNGKNDQIVIWFKPKQKPKWMTAEQYAELDDEIMVRELRYRVCQRGFRVEVVTVVTTLLDADVYTLAHIAQLYRMRWKVEVNFRHIKITMKMDILKCKTVEGVLKELYVYAIAYNLLCSVIAESARVQKVPADRIGFVDTLRWMLDPGPDGDVSKILVNPDRPDRVEPRVRKRRPKQYPVMKRPRTELRNELLGQDVAA